MHSETAYLGLIDSLARGFRALRDPACTRWLGPVVPGATMASGARVPGTSYALDPVQAAFNLGVMFGWPDRDFDGPERVVDAGPADTYAGVVAAADFLARQAIAEARPPLTLQDVLARLAEAQAIQQRLAPAAIDTSAPHDHALPARVATSAVVAAMMGGSHEHVLRAATYAWIGDGGRESNTAADVAAMDTGWRRGEAASRGVRLAWLARAAGPDCNGAGLPGAAAAVELIGRPHDAGLPLARSDAGRIRARFEASVVQHFPPAQAARIRALYGAPEALAATPFNQCMSALVKN
jgi:2-methylcitrate dehydratase